MATTWNGQVVSVLMDSADPVIPWPSGDTLEVQAFHVAGADVDVIQTAGKRHRVLTAKLWLDAVTFEALYAMLGVVSDITGWPVQGGGSVNFLSYMLQSLSQPVRRLTTGTEVYETTATWFSTT